MRALVRFRLPEGGTAELGPGDLIGRLWSAALSIPDPRISEAHAMISLRGEELKLLALRGRFAVDGRSQSGVVLEAGQRITLADGLDVMVEEVVLPAAVFAIEGDGLPRVVVAGPCSLLTRPRPELVPRLIPEAPAWLWSDGEVWCLSIAGQRRQIMPGDRWELDGLQFRALGLKLGHAGRTATRLEGTVVRPLRIVARFDTVHLYPQGGDPIALNGLAARIVSEVVSFDGPVPWEVLARELWPSEDDSHVLRHKLDVNLSRLRGRLREAGLRGDLVRSDGFGHVELFLYDGDEVEDRT